MRCHQRSLIPAIALAATLAAAPLEAQTGEFVNAQPWFVDAIGGGGLQRLPGNQIAVDQNRDDDHAGRDLRSAPRHSNAAESRRELSRGSAVAVTACALHQAVPERRLCARRMCQRSAGLLPRARPRVRHDAAEPRRRVPAGRGRDRTALLRPARVRPGHALEPAHGGARDGDHRTNVPTGAALGRSRQRRIQPRRGHVQRQRGADGDRSPVRPRRQRRVRAARLGHGVSRVLADRPVQKPRGRSVGPGQRGICRSRGRRSPPTSSPAAVRSSPRCDSTARDSSAATWLSTTFSDRPTCCWALASWALSLRARASSSPTR